MSSYQLHVCSSGFAGHDICTKEFPKTQAASGGVMDETMKHAQHHPWNMLH